MARRPGLSIVEADLEDGPWPFAGQQFGGIVVCNYLWRPLFPHVAATLAPGGVLIWTTFAAGNEAFGRPRNPDFLLQSNELLEAFAGSMEIVAFRQGHVARPGPAVRQSMVARRRDMDRAGGG
ncbi:MAG: hypothetical protein ACMVY4_18640 [Minwuia sp.]|uniref:hypothetical protein n=1 Tax=Minwuia sp. TaxID=2493630 RepID=UPI003A86AC2A